MFIYDIGTCFMHLETLWNDSPGVTDSHKLQTVVRAIPSDVAARISAVLTATSENDKYEAVKAA